DGELRVAAHYEFRQAAERAGERLVGQELGREGLVVLRREVEGRADVGEGRQRDRAEDGHAVLEVAEELRVAAEEVELPADEDRVRPRGAGEGAEADELSAQRVGDSRDRREVSDGSLRDGDVARGDEHVERNDGADRADVVAAYGELVAEEEALVDGHARDRSEERR